MRRCPFVPPRQEQPCREQPLSRRRPAHRSTACFHASFADAPSGGASSACRHLTLARRTDVRLCRKKGHSRGTSSATSTAASNAGACAYRWDSSTITLPERAAQHASPAQCKRPRAKPGPCQARRNAPGESVSHPHLQRPPAVTRAHFHPTNTVEGGGGVSITTRRSLPPFLYPKTLSPKPSIRWHVHACRL
jgi:hypothetical protein